MLSYRKLPAGKRAALAAATLLCVLIVSGCGFRPLYQQNGTSDTISGRLNAVAIDNIPNREGQQLRNLLIDRLYAEDGPDQPRYLLKFSPLRENITSLGIRKDATATRAQMRLSTTMTVWEKSTGKIILTQPLQASNSFNILDSQYTTLVTENDARQRLLSEISDRVVTELALLLKSSSAEKNSGASDEEEAP